LPDPAITNPAIDGSTLDVQAVNIEENGNRTPIPYVVPPGITASVITITCKQIPSLMSIAIVKRSQPARWLLQGSLPHLLNDLRAYKRIQMFITRKATI